MNKCRISCISPVDGRYSVVTEPLREFFTEKALIRYRLAVEIDYFIALCKIPLPPLASVSASQCQSLKELLQRFSDEDVMRIKEHEQTTKHDIKAIEYFLKEKMDALGMKEYREFIHFGLTSQDINNTAIPLLLKDGLHQVIFPVLNELLNKLHNLSTQWIHVSMLARTHGQPASPTTMGKEILVFHERISKQLEQLKRLPFPAKFGGATGNLNAHLAAYPDHDWISFSNNFLSGMGLTRSRYTTQIDHYDGLAAIFDALKRICTIIIDLDRDLWSYISMNYFSQKINPEETGSSTMPHKVNPIDFENAEGNAGLAVALFEHLSAKLPISRLQRDLTDSTVLRNTGVPLAHMLIAIRSTLNGLGKISLNQPVIDLDLENNLVVVAEAIQTILRKLQVPEPYEKLRELTRKPGKITRDELNQFIDSLDIPDKEKLALKMITPFNYTGIIPSL